MKMSLRSTLIASMRSMEQDDPEGLRTIVEASRGLNVRLEVEDERFNLRASDGKIEILEATPAQVLLRTKQKVLLDMLDGQAEPLTMLLDGSLYVSGSSQSLVRAGQILQSYLCIAAERPSQAKILEDYRRRATTE